MRSFVEIQFPVAQLSIESYIERDAKGSKLLSSLAKWWGAKPIVLSRALLIGTVMPANEDPGKWPEDLEIFLRLMTLDPDGMWHRKVKPLPAATCWPHASAREKATLFSSEERWKARADKSERLGLERRVFSAWEFTRQREYCCRVDQIDGPPPESWKRVNEYFRFEQPVTTLAEVVPLLSRRRFGRVVSVGDAFAGSGVLPVAAAELALPAYAADLNPAASLLSWSAVNLVGGKEEFRAEVHAAQEALYQRVQAWLDENRYERSEEGWPVQAYLYCEEIRVSEWDGWAIPVAPNWIIAPKTETWVELVPDPARKRFNFRVRYSGEGYKQAEVGTKDGDGLICPAVLWKLFQQEGSHRNKPRQVSKSALVERAGGLRMWSREDIAPRPDDILQERLFCIRWLRPSADGGSAEIFYREPTPFDLEVEQRMEAHLRSVREEWSAAGWVPSWQIEDGEKTTEPKRTKGWTHWHQLFTPHQLLVLGKYSGLMAEYPERARIALLMALAKLLDMNNRLCHWLPSQGGGVGGSKRLFYNQAFNPFPNYAARGWQALSDQAQPQHLRVHLAAPVEVLTLDARETDYQADLWLTDPPYADAVHYEELTEFFLAWYAPHLQAAFPQWPKDSRRIQTIKGADEGFTSAMAASYARLTQKMPGDGYQIIMFTHKSSDVWSDLTMIVWEAGLEIVAVWNVATETSGLGVRSGDHVQTTYNLVLRKRTSDKTGFMDQIKRQVKRSASEVIAHMEVERQQVGSYSCGYGETDVLLAAQAAAAQVITQFKAISDFAGRSSEEQRSGIRSVLETARQTAADQLLPRQLRAVCGDASINPENWWKDLCPEEHMYFKGLEVQASGEARLSVFQDLARIYGVRDYADLMASTEPNASRPVAPPDLSAGRTTRYEEVPETDRNQWRHSTTRNVLVAVQKVLESNDADSGLTHLKLVTDFWAQRSERIVPIINYLMSVSTRLMNWRKSAPALNALEVAVRNARA